MAPVRPAVEADVTELVRLRAAFAEHLTAGVVFATQSAAANWRTTCAEVLKEQLSGSTICVLVIDADDGLAACGYGTIAQMVPGPHLPDGINDQEEPSARKPRGRDRTEQTKPCAGGSVSVAVAH